MLHTAKINQQNQHRLLSVYSYLVILQRHLPCKTMKKTHGSIFEYEDERNKDLIRAYREQLDRHYHHEHTLSLKRVFKDVAESPSRRFWVSEERAAIVISEMMKGKKLEKMGKMKREMYHEIYKRVIQLRQQYPKLSIIQLVTKVCAQPAPRFYLTPLSVKVIIYKIKRQWYEERKQKLRFLF